MAKSSGKSRQPPSHSANDGSGVSRPAMRRRGIERRKQLLEATLRILSSRGGAYVTHRNVAAEASVPIAATTYYFASKDELIKEAFRLHAEMEAERVVSAAKAMDTAFTVDQLADQLADFVYDGLHSSRSSLVSEYELLLQSARRPELEEFARIFLDTVRKPLVEIVSQIGSVAPEADVRLIMAVLAGLEVDNLATPSTAVDLAELRTLTRRLLRALLSDPAPS
jgi:DNA-binding transcriptional regulator YbjK